MEPFQDSLSEPLLMLVVSVLAVLSLMLKTGARRFLHVPPVVAYMGLGIGLRLVQMRFALLSDEARWTLRFLGQLGVVGLLFHVGLRSDLRGLARQLPRALPVWVSNVAASAGFGFVATWALGFGLVPALFVAAALSATSVGVSVMAWEDAGRIRSRTGALLIDVAELDDLSAIVLMLAAMAAAPLLHQGGSLGAAIGAATLAAGGVLSKVVVFAGGCWLFARHGQARLSGLLARNEATQDRLLSIVGVGFAMAAIAGALGLSVAVGALFAGLVFSRDADTVRQESSIDPLLSFFTPFFFIDIGFAMNAQALGASARVGLWLFLPAALGKLLGAGLPILRRSGLLTATVLGISMLPRAEIALLVAHTAQQMGPWAMPDVLYGALVFACGLCTTLSPLILPGLLKRLPD